MHLRIPQTSAMQNLRNPWPNCRFFEVRIPWKSPADSVEIASAVVWKATADFPAESAANPHPRPHPQMLKAKEEFSVSACPILLPEGDKQHQISPAEPQMGKGAPHPCQTPSQPPETRHRDTQALQAADGRRPGSPVPSGPTPHSLPWHAPA